MATGSDINISLPVSWYEMTEKQLEMVYRLFSMEMTPEEVKVYCVLRWNNIRIITKIGGKYLVKVGRRSATITARQLYNIAATLDFIGQLPAKPVRFEKYKGRKALPADFSEVPFQSYMAADNIFQGFLQTERWDLLHTLVRILYDDDDIEPDRTACVMAFYWFAALKQMMARRFHHFYQPVAAVEEGNLLKSKSLHEKLTDAVNGQIRALTGGDVTKEPYIMSMDTIRALTELDAKAADAEEMKRKSK